MTGSPDSNLRVWIIVGILVCLALGGAAWAVFRILRDLRRGWIRASDAAVALAERVNRSFTDQLGLRPRVTIGGRTHCEGSLPTLELVVLKKSVTRTVQWTSTHFGSTKRLTATGTFTLRVGVDLRKPVEVEITADGKGASARVPKLRILSIQVEDAIPMQEEPGWWNRIRPEDRTQVLRELQEGTKAEALASGILLEGEARMRAVLASAWEGPGTDRAISCTFVEDVVEAPSASQETGPGRTRTTS